jgi:hypothetical protein
MATAEKYRAFARECRAWVDRAQTIEHRKALQDFAKTWAEAAALLNHQHNLIDQFNELKIAARRSLQAARKVTDGNGVTQAGGWHKQSEAA